jgi:hypothetical protein
MLVVVLCDLCSSDESLYTCVCACVCVRVSLCLHVFVYVCVCVLYHVVDAEGRGGVCRLVHLQLK